MAKKLVNKNMNFIEVMRKNPNAANILFKNGMYCIGCGLAGNETLEQGALAHGLDPDKLVNEINKEVAKIKKKIKKKSKNKEVKSKKKNKIKKRKKQ